MSRLDDARRKRGEVFNALRNAQEADNAAWYEAEDKQAFAREAVQTRQSLIKQLQRDVDRWEAS